VTTVAGPAPAVDSAVDGEAALVSLAAGDRAPLDPPEISWAKESPIDGAVAEIVAKKPPQIAHFKHRSLPDPG
jgi:hypothetical protein